MGSSPRVRLRFSVRGGRPLRILGTSGLQIRGLGRLAAFSRLLRASKLIRTPWLIPPLAWTATAAELGFGIALVGGFFPRVAGFGSAILLSLFAIAMSISFGIKKPLDYSVFTDAGGALLLGLLATHRIASK